MVPVLTLFFLPAGMVNLNSWPRLKSESLGMLTAAESCTFLGQQDNTASSITEHVSHARPRRCTDIEEWSYHHGPEEHPAPFALQASSPGRQCRT